jgi:hypothetical protein
MINKSYTGKDLEGSGRRIIEVASRNFVVVTRKTTKNIRIADVPDKIRRKNLPIRVCSIMATLTHSAPAVFFFRVQQRVDLYPENGDKMFLRNVSTCNY